MCIDLGIKLFSSFRYDLTRALNSDPVESLYSSFRQFNGGNDRVDARTAVFTAEKLLKVYLEPIGEHTHVTYALFFPRLESSKLLRVETLPIAPKQMHL